MLHENNLSLRNKKGLGLLSLIKLNRNIHLFNTINTVIGSFFFN